MIDYIRDNLIHAPGCDSGPRWVQLEDVGWTLDVEVRPCTCPRAEALKWLEDREAFVEAFRAAKNVDAATVPLWQMEKIDAELRAAFARLEGE